MAENAASDFLANELLDHTLKDADYTPPAVIAIALYSTPTDDSSGGTELDDAFAYARLEVEHATGRTFSAAASGQTDNDQEWSLAPASGDDWATATHASLNDSADHSESTPGGGNKLFHGAMAAPKTVEDGDTLRFAAGAFAVSIT
jgi:hypothetical protein